MKCDDAHLGVDHNTFERSEEIRSVKSYSSRLDQEAKQLDQLASAADSVGARDFYKAKAIQKRAVAEQLRKKFTPALTK